MIRYVLKRLALILVSIVVASVIIFLITEIIPGDVAQMILGQNVTPDALQALRDRLGLMAPSHIRYLRWIAGVVQGNLGDSLSMQGVSIADLIIRRGRNSLFLAAASTILLVPLSLLLGVTAGLKEEKWPDRVISTVSLVAISLPEFIGRHVPRGSRRRGAEEQGPVPAVPSLHGSAPLLAIRPPRGPR